MVCIHFQLAHIGVPKEQVTWSRVTLTSDKWISVRHDNPEDLSNRRATVSTEFNYCSSKYNTEQQQMQGGGGGGIILINSVLLFFPFFCIVQSLMVFTYIVKQAVCEQDWGRGEEGFFGGGGGHSN